MDLAGPGSCGLTPWGTAWRTTCTRLSTTHRWHSTADVGVTAHDHVHESHWVLLDSGVDLGIVLLEARHELLVKLWVLAHTLSHVRELWVRHQAHQLCVLTAWHSHAATWHSTGTGLSRASIFVAVIVSITFLTT